VVVVETQSPESTEAEVAQPGRGAQAPQVSGRQAMAATGAPELLVECGVPPAAEAAGAAARSAAVSPATEGETAARIGAPVAGAVGWAGEGVGRLAMDGGGLMRAREPMDARGLIETAEERRARVEAYR